MEQRESEHPRQPVIAHSVASAVLRCRIGTERRCGAGRRLGPDSRQCGPRQGYWGATNLLQIVGASGANNFGCLLMIRGRYSGVGGRDVDKHQQTKRVDMSRRMRRAQPKSAMRSIRVAIGAGPQHSLTRAPADDHAARGEFSRVRHPHLLFSCIFRSPPPARRRRSSRNRAAVLRMSAAADDCPFRREIHSPSGISAAVDAGSRRRCVRGVAPGSREFSPIDIYAALQSISCGGARLRRQLTLSERARKWQAESAEHPPAADSVRHLS
jgi:hypothetical protein